MTTHHVIIQAVTVGRDPDTNELTAALVSANGMITVCRHLHDWIFETQYIEYMDTNQRQDISHIEIDVKAVLDTFVAEPPDPRRN